MNNRNVQVQGLRGLSCILIIIFHLTCRYCQIYVADFRAWDYLGGLSGLGVATFCILSGYYIAKDNRSGKLFIISRAKKIYPTYLLIVIISFFAVRAFSLPYRSVKVTDLVLNLFCLNGYLQKPYVDGAHWYITTLLSVIIIWGGISCRKAKKEWAVISWIGLWGISLIGSRVVDNARFISHGLNFVYLLLGGAYLSMFLIGVCIAYIDKVIWRLILIVSVLSVAVLFKVEGVLDISLGACLVYGSTKERLKFLNNRFLTRVGDVSYELYLLHQNLGFVIIYYLSSVCSGYHFYFSIISIAVILLIGEAVRKIKAWNKAEV